MLIGILVLIIALLLYAMIGRQWLKTQPWAKNFFAWIEPTEIALYRKSETLLVSRLLSVGGLMVTAYDTFAVSFSNLDITPVTTRVLARVPDDMRGLVVSASFAALGMLIGWLRKRTTQPVEITEIAAKDVTPKIAEAIAMADSTKTEAVAAVTAAKAA